MKSMTHGYTIHKNDTGFTVWSFDEDGTLNSTVKLRCPKGMKREHRIEEINKYLKHFNFEHKPKVKRPSGDVQDGR